MPLTTSRYARLKSGQTALLLIGIVVAAFALPGDLQARNRKPQPILKACTCDCYGGDGVTRGYIEMFPETMSCSSADAEDCQTTGPSGDQGGLLANCQETPEIEGKPRPGKKRFPRQTKKQTPRSPGSSY